MKPSFAVQRVYTRPGKLGATFGDFVCLHCGSFVSAEAALSGVHNRNHCPFCLSSRHLDHFEPGDRLSACKARMRPVGLTHKRTVKKYASVRQGELMLVHLCEDCGKVSLNRIAADDDDAMILAVLEESATVNPDTRALLAQEGITLLSAAEANLVRTCLYGDQRMPAR
jgi:hypothetical protein